MSNAESTPKVVVVIDPASSRVGAVVGDLLRRDGAEVVVLDVEGAPRPRLPSLEGLVRSLEGLDVASRAAAIRLASFTRSFVDAGLPRFELDAGRRRVELILIIAALGRG